MGLLWQLLIVLFALTATSLQDLNVEARKNNKAARQWTLEDDGSDTAGPSQIDQPPGEGGYVMGMGSDIPISNNGRDGCNSDKNGLFRRIIARDVNSCGSNFLQFGRSEDNRRQPLPVKPKAQQGGGGQNSGGSDEPEHPLLLPAGENDPYQYIFIPREKRPTQDPGTCPDPWRPIPICGRPQDTYSWTNGVNPGVVVDPAYLYLPVGGCISMEGDRIGYCCLFTEVAYAFDGLDKIEIDAWRVLLESGGNSVHKVEEKLMSGARSPYKLIGLNCKPIELEGTERGRVKPF